MKLILLLSSCFFCMYSMDPTDPEKKYTSQQTITSLAIEVKQLASLIIRNYQQNPQWQQQLGLYTTPLRMQQAVMNLMQLNQSPNPPKITEQQVYTLVDSIEDIVFTLAKLTAQGKLSKQDCDQALISLGKANLTRRLSKN